jgi:guanine deaminase
LTEGGRRILRGRVLSPVDPTRVEAFEDGFVAIDPDGTIADAGPWPADFDPRTAIDAGRALILPAFVDAHVHLPQMPVRARYGDPLLAWLARHVYPAEAAFADPDYAAREAVRFFEALAAVGTGTAGVFATVHAEATHRAFEAAAASGLRIVMGNVLMDREAPAELLEPGAGGVRATLELAERWEGSAGGRLHVAVTPRFAPACSETLLTAAGEAARGAGLRVQTHLAESADEIEAVRRLFPGAVDYLAVYERAGLAGERAIFAHAIHLGAAEFRRIAGSGAAVACCPSSNAFLGAGRFPLAAARAAGVEIGLGSDVGAGPQLSVLDAARHLGYLERPAPAEILYRTTLGGARALDLAGRTGRLAPGLAADILVLEPPPDATGDPLELFVQCVFRQPETRVVALLVDGAIVHGSLEP